MKRAALALIVTMFLAGGVAFAHGDAEHVQGTVTNITATAITLETAAKQTRTITINDKTMVMRGKSHLAIADIKVGDRVVLDVDKKTSLVTEVKLGTATASAKASTEHKDHKN